MRRRSANARRVEVSIGGGAGACDARRHAKSPLLVGLQHLAHLLEKGYTANVKIIYLDFK
jgi:hypothetical protein